MKLDFQKNNLKGGKQICKPLFDGALSNYVIRFFLYHNLSFWSLFNVRSIIYFVTVSISFPKKKIKINVSFSR